VQPGDWRTRQTAMRRPWKSRRSGRSCACAVLTDRRLADAMPCNATTARIENSGSNPIRLARRRARRGHTNPPTISPHNVARWRVWPAAVSPVGRRPTMDRTLADAMPCNVASARIKNWRINPMRSAQRRARRGHTNPPTKSPYNVARWRAWPAAGRAGSSVAGGPVANHGPHARGRNAIQREDRRACPAAGRDGSSVADRTMPNHGPHARGRNAIQREDPRAWPAPGRAGSGAADPPMPNRGPHIRRRNAIQRADRRWRAVRRPAPSPRPTSTAVPGRRGASTCAAVDPACWWIVAGPGRRRAGIGRLGPAKAAALRQAGVTECRISRRLRTQCHAT